GTDVHWRLTPHITEPIRIGPNCYIGAHAYIGPGVTIGEGAVIGPGSVISKDIGPFEIWAGYPASLIAHRTEQRVYSTLRRHLDLVAMFGVTVPSEPQ
ncbi:MAG TPA: DapH/DapD/GlmU-related protein, partial [Candidatus Hydrogenedentes bacterium]|nr:DapH/DapD/GlmU-related protein [Candidatus Hydrogenedentota bacterium]